MYAIRHKRAWPEKWVYGTDWRYNPPRQRTSEEKALLFENLEEAQHQFNHRQCAEKSYEIVCVRIEAIE